MKIALCGYLGAGCTRVAKILASRLVLKSIDKAVNTSGILSSANDSYLLSRSGESDLDMVIKKRTEDLLKRDNIIVEGRSAFMLLDREDVTKVFLNTPSDTRIKRVADRRGISIEEAREDVERSDEDRNSLIQRFCNKNYPDAKSFDFSMKTSSKTFSEVAEIIDGLIKSRKSSS